ncbi:hypothetical protein C8F01DRAFT_1080919 [Mycena amicta]|nr:hypothetical protein C8F01DRAFT_1080919 [Mycena amicta]
MAMGDVEQGGQVQMQMDGWMDGCDPALGLLQTPNRARGSEVRPARQRWQKMGENVNGVYFTPMADARKTSSSDFGLMRYLDYFLGWRILKYYTDRVFTLKSISRMRCPCPYLGGRSGHGLWVGEVLHFTTGFSSEFGLCKYELWGLERSPLQVLQQPQNSFIQSIRSAVGEPNLAKFTLRSRRRFKFSIDYRAPPAREGDLGVGATRLGIRIVWEPAGGRLRGRLYRSGFGNTGLTGVLNEAPCAQADEAAVHQTDRRRQTFGVLVAYSRLKAKMFVGIKNSVGPKP